MWITKFLTPFKFAFDLALIFNSNPLQNLFFKCCDDPRHLHCPFTSTVIRVHRASHSSMLCEVRTTDLPSLRNLMIKFHKLRLVAGSMPVVGSSYFQQKQMKISKLHFWIWKEHFSFASYNALTQKYDARVSNQSQRCAQFSLIATAQLHRLFVNVLNEVQLFCIVFNVRLYAIGWDTAYHCEYLQCVTAT